MPSLEPLMTVTATLSYAMIGDVGAGTRLDVPFTGTATSSHWDGELPVEGVDYVTLRSDGFGELLIKARMGSGKDLVSYDATGINGPDGIQELLTFRTGSETFKWLNGITAVAFGATEGDQLTLEVYKVVA